MIFLILKDDFFNRGLFLGFFLGPLKRKVSSQQGLNWKRVFFCLKDVFAKKKFLKKDIMSYEAILKKR